MLRNDVRIVIWYMLLTGLFLLPVVFAFSIPDALAQTSNFEVRTLVGGDSAPPTVPTGLTATPIATTQIDLSWNPSIDDFILSGYQVWRDDTFIATTTATNYSDVGLTASTTYSYYVTAFDSFFNFSASSSVATATTLSIPSPVATSTDGSTQGTRIRPFGEQILTLEVLPGKDSVVIRYETHAYIRSVIRWGRTSSYELGSLVERAFSTEHETRINGLTPGVTYYFTIEGENRVGRYGTMYSGSFTTLPPEDTFPPGNVRGLTAIVDGEDALLSWINPGDADFVKVRVMRSDRFYPTDTADGWLVYEGPDTAIRDVGVIQEGITQYYTVFTYDELGNISSGAAVSVSLKGEGESQEIISEVDPTKNEISFSFEDVLFAQEGIVVPTKNGEVRIDGSKQLTISIPYDHLPEHLKTILIVIRDGESNGPSFKFLLKVNKEKTFYTGTLAPFGKSGVFPVEVSVIDYKTSQIGYAKGTVISRIEFAPSVPVGLLEYLTSLSLGYWYTILFLILLILLMILGHRILSRDA